jgi:hypothetical protein
MYETIMRKASKSRKSKTQTERVELSLCSNGSTRETQELLFASASKVAMLKLPLHTPLILTIPNSESILLWGGTRYRLDKKTRG